MVTRITLGNFVSNNGRTTVTGSQSGLDTESIVKALVEARRLPAVRLEKRNETLDQRSGALNDLRSLMNRFKSAVDTLRNPPGVNNDSQNVFQYRATSLTATGGFLASNYVDVSAQPGAELQSFNITNIDRIARETRQESSTFTLASPTVTSVVAPASTPGMFTAGTFSLRNVSGGAAASITLNSGDSLQTVANKFNEVSNTTGIRANILKVSSGPTTSDYKLVFTATQTGTTYGFDLTTAGTVPSDPSGVLTNVITAPPTQTAQDARFFVDGIEIIRQSNNISDVFTGVTLNLKQANAGVTNIGVTVRPDTEIVKNAVTSFVDVYNEFRLFASKQTEIGDDGLAKETALLAGDSTLRSVISRVSAEMSAIVAGIGGGNPTRLIDIGLEFKDFEGDAENPFTRSILTIDDVKLSSAISSNFEGVRSLMEFRMQSDNANVTVFRRTNALNEQNLSLQINRSTGTYVAVRDTNITTIQRTSNLLLADTNADSAVRAVDGSNSLFRPGTFSLKNINGGADVNVTLNEGDTLETVRNAFNAVSGSTGFSAAIVTVSPGNYRLDFTSTTTGTRGVFDLNNAVTLTSDSSDVFGRITRTTFQSALPPVLMQRSVQTTGNMLVADLGTASAVQAAAPAGDGLFRPGTFQLSNINGGANVSITLTEGMTLNDVMSAFNAQSANTGLTASARAISPGTYVLDFASNKYGVEGMFDLNNANTLVADTSGVFTNVTRTTTTAPTLLDPRILELDGEVISGSSGVLLKGRDGTDLEGLELIYAISGNASANLGITQGIGDRLFNMIEEISDEQEGILTTALTQLEDQVTRNETEIERIDQQIERYRAQIEAQYSALEEALARANSLLQLLDAQARAREGS